MGCCRFTFGVLVHGGLSEDPDAVAGGAQLSGRGGDRGVLAPGRGPGEPGNPGAGHHRGGFGQRRRSGRVVPGRAPEGVRGV
jgi:hypothetical protein